MNFYVMTLFPEMVMQGLNTSITGRAIEKGILNIEAIDIRNYTKEKHGRTDDYPYGGGAGMLMQAQPVFDCYKAVLQKISDKKSGNVAGSETVALTGNETGTEKVSEAESIPKVLYMSPQGSVFNQKMAENLSREEDLILLCGHYEGIDERALELIGAEPVSVGDYVLTGGELPAMMIVDCISRLIPGVLGHEESAVTESFSGNLLEYPQYTRPEEFMGLKVPEILLSGHHANIARWQRDRSIERTYLRRPELLKEAEFDKKDLKYLKTLLSDEEFLEILNIRSQRENNRQK